MRRERGKRKKKERGGKERRVSVRGWWVFSVCVGGG